MSTGTALTRLRRRLFAVRGLAYLTLVPLGLLYGGGTDVGGSLVLFGLVACFLPWLIERRTDGALLIAMAFDSIMAVLGGAALGQPILFELGPVLAVGTAALLLSRGQAAVVLTVALTARTLAVFGALGRVPTTAETMLGPRLTGIVLATVLWGFIVIVFRQFRLTLMKASQRAIDAEVRWREYLDNTDQAIFIHLNGVVVDVNPRMRELAGRDIVSVPVVEVIAELDDGSSGDVREAILFASDGPREVEVVTLPTTLEGATAELSVVTDLTTKRVAERETRRLNEEINSLFNRLPVALYRSTPDGRVLACNGATAELLGYRDSQEVAALRSPTAFFARPSQQDEFHLRMAETGFVSGYEHEVRRRDGRAIWVESTARAVYDEAGNIRYFEGAMIDITARMSAAEANERLLAIIEQASDIVVVIGANGHILYANRAARTFYGVSEDGETVTYLPIAPAWLHEARDALSADRPFAAEQILHTPAGSTRRVHAVIEGHRDRYGQLSHISIIARDITELREAQERLERLVASKDEFIASVSHELRTPLSVVVGLSQEIMVNRAIDDRERAELLDMIAEQSLEVAELVEDLLVAARADTGAIRIHAEPLTLRDSVDAVIRTVLPHRHIVIEGDAKVLADAHRVRQILRNLVTNAHKYGGESIRVSITNGAGAARLVVADNGSGIPVEARKRVFDPYERAHHEPTRPGSVGLGLSVSRHLARLMDGELRYSYDNGWSQFELELPALAD